MHDCGVSDDTRHAKGLPQVHPEVRVAREVRRTDDNAQCRRGRDRRAVAQGCGAGDTTCTVFFFFFFFFWENKNIEMYVFFFFFSISISISISISKPPHPTSPPTNPYPFRSRVKIINKHIDTKRSKGRDIPAPHLGRFRAATATRAHAA
jgi:hypothetical protein